MKQFISGILLLGSISVFAEEKILFNCSIEGTNGYGKAQISMNKEKGTYSYKTKFNDGDWETFFETREALIFLTNSDSTGYVEYYDYVYQPEMTLSTVRIDINTDFSAKGSGEHFTPYNHSTYTITSLKNCTGEHLINL